MTQYRLLVRPEVMQQLAALKRAAETQQPGGLRDRELRTLRLGLRALANGQEESFNGKRLGCAGQDLSDCAEIKLAVIPENRGNQDLGPSHRLLYREFESEDGGPPYREIVAFEPRKDDRPFEIAAIRLGRDHSVSQAAAHSGLSGLDSQHAIPSATPTSAAAPTRQPLPPDLRAALAAASNVAPAHGAVTTPASTQTRPTAPHRGAPPTLER